MAHFGRLRDFHISDDEHRADDIRGADVFGLDDKKLGKIDDVIFDHSTGTIRYVIVDAGGWLSSKKFIIPPQQLYPSVEHEGDFAINLNKKQIEKFPPYDESAFESEGKWRDYESRYQESWVSGAVQHREGSDHNITPTAAEMPAEAGSIGSQLDEDEIERLTPNRITPAGSDEVVINNTAVGIGGRWSNFEDRLRQRRKEIIDQCETCREESRPGTASQRERDDFQKAS